MKKTRADGTTYYYYYKKKCGRRKKPGPKRKKKKPGRSWQEPWNYKIVKCSFNRQTEFIGIFHNIGEIELVKEKLKEINKNVLFPKMYINNTSERNLNNTLEAKNEYLFLERIATSTSPDIPKLTNEYGKLIEVTTNSEEWKVYDRIPCLEEETFWIYGLHPKTERKDILWVYDNMLLIPLKEVTYSIIQIFVYKNKVLFRLDNHHPEFVVCKNCSDAIRMYNLLLEWCHRDKVKNVYFTGSVLTCTPKGRKLVDELVSVTGWSRKKVMSKAT